MPSTVIIYETLKSTITGYIDLYRDAFCKNYSLFGTAGVPRAREMLAELTLAFKKPDATSRDLISIVGQDKYDTGVVLRNRIVDTVLKLCDVKQNKIDEIADDVAQELNIEQQRLLLYNRHAYLIYKKYESTDDVIQNTAKLRLYYRILNEIDRQVKNDESKPLLLAKV